MADYDNNNRGILGRNDRREKDTQPEFTGQINVEGVDYWLNGWVKERKDGSGKFFSLSVKRKEPLRVQEQSKSNHSDAPLSEQLNDSIPF